MAKFFFQEMKQAYGKNINPFANSALVVKIQGGLKKCF